MPTRGSKDPNGRALRGRRAHTTFALLSDPVRQIWDAFNNRANTANADAPEAAVNGCLYDRFKGLYTKVATKPSLVIVPARFKSGTLYSQIPSSNADFTVTRNTAARRFDSAGLIASVASGIPRLDYYTSGGVTGCPALLVEPAATNLLSGSSDFSNTTYWARPAGANVTGNVTGITAPDGTNTAALFQASGTTATNSRLRQTISRTTTGSHAFSVFIKGFAGVAASGALYTDVGLTVLSFAITSGGVVSLTSMTGAGAVTSGITQFPDGWYRITAVGTAATSGSTQNEIYCEPSGRQYYCWGAQLETGSVATSYIPTTAGTGSRSADVISVSGAVSGSIGQTEGTVYMEMQADAAGTGQNFLYVGGNVNDSIVIGKSGANCFFELKVSGTTLISQNVALSGTPIKGAIAYANGNYAAYANGNLLASGTTSRTPANALTAIAFSNFLNLPTINAPSAIMRVRAAALYTTRLSNGELQSLTTL